MTRAQLETFLRGSGVVFSAPDAADANVIDFISRGTSVRAIAYEDGDLLHLVIYYRMPDAQPPAAAVQKIFQDLEDEYPIVKLAAVASERQAGFTVTAEQFAPDPAAIHSVFWRTVDLIVRVADDGFQRLANYRDAASEEAPESNGAWLAQIEEMVRQGSDTADPLPDPNAAANINARVKVSLALLVRPDGATGSAFCFSSDEFASYYVTNAHVVTECSFLPLYRQKPKFERHTATVIARGDGHLDLAILRVDEPDIPSLTLRGQPALGECDVALAGYARVHILAAEQFGELVPSIRHGTITGILKRGACVLHDVLCRPGDSGAPLFDPHTGDVVGVQAGGWTDEEEGYAIGVSELLEMIRSNPVTTANGVTKSA